MSFRNVSKRCPARRSSLGLLRRRRILVEQLESRQLLAGDVLTGGMGFVDSLPTAQEAQFGSVVLTDEGREVCLAFMAVGTAEGEDPIDSLDDPGPVDLSAVIVQPAGPLAQGAAFTSEITFENAGPNDAIATVLGVTFDANLTGITWEREIVRAQPATVAAADLDGSNGLALQGIEEFDFSGFAVSGGGDFNNDGIDDFIIGASEPDIAPTAQDGDAYVVFGTAGGFPANIALDSLTGTNGFSFLGFGAGGNAGTSVDNAGDVNGDGIEDLIVGAPGADPGAVNDAGEAYVIFGRATFPSQITAGTMLAADGFKIGGTPEGYNLGNSVAGAGDVNGDGISDIIVGANGKRVPNPANPVNSTLSQGTSFVIFGRPQATPFPASVDVTTLAVTEGFEIGTSDTQVSLGLSVDGAGDINGDGIDDVIIGMPDGAGSSGQGKVYVVFGKSTGFASLIDVTTMPVADGFAIPTPRAGHLFGSHVAGVGDVNGDGIDDFMAVDGINDTVAAQSYLVFGSNTAFPASLDVSALNGTAGVIVEGPAASHPSAMRVSGAGDVNGDGVMDLLVGLPATGGASALPGGSYVVFGSDAGFTSPLNLSSLNGANGFLIQGRTDSGLAGTAVAAAGDVNGDGLDDVIVGARFESPGGNTAAGESYVVFGRGSTTTSGSGATISETLDLFPGDKVIYRVSATIAPAATVSTIVNATTTVGPGVSDTNNANDSDSATTLIAAAAPTLESIQINDGGASRSQVTSVTVTFDSIVDHTLLGNAFTLTQIDNSTQVGTVIVSPDSTSGKTVATLTFDGASTVSRLGTGPLGNSLADGNYRLDLLAANVVSGGTPMASDLVFGGQAAADSPNDGFFRLFGDSNGDGIRNGIDVNDFIPTIFNAPGYRSDLDSNGDGVINGIDVNDFVPTIFGSGRP